MESVPAVPCPGVIRLVPGLESAIVPPAATLHAVVLSDMRQSAKYSVPVLLAARPLVLNIARSLLSATVPLSA